MNSTARGYIRVLQELTRGPGCIASAAGAASPSLGRTTNVSAILWPLRRRACSGRHARRRGARVLIGGRTAGASARCRHRWGPRRRHMIHRRPFVSALPQAARGELVRPSADCRHWIAIAADQAQSRRVPRHTSGSGSRSLLPRQWPVSMRLITLAYRSARRPGSGWSPPRMQ